MKSDRSCGWNWHPWIVYACLAALAWIVVSGYLSTAAKVRQVELEVLEPPERTQLLSSIPMDVGITFPRDELFELPNGDLPELRLLEDDRSIPFTARSTGW